MYTGKSGLEIMVNLIIFLFFNKHVLTSKELWVYRVFAIDNTALIEFGLNGYSAESL